VEIRQEEFVSALTELVLRTPLSLKLPQHEGRVHLASWNGGESRDTAQQMMERQCAPSAPPDGCLILPKNALPPETLARMRLALSFAMDTVWEGAAVPLSEYLDPLAFKVMVCTAMSTYLLMLMIPVPEPVTKGLAAVLTLYLVAYLGLGPVWSMVEAGWRLLKDVERTTTAEELKEAGHRFGRVLGDSGMRVLLLLATAALSGEASFLGKGPGLPGFGQAALASPARTGVTLGSAGQVKSVALGIKQLTVVLAPTAVAATAMGPMDGNNRAPTALEIAEAGGKHAGFLKNYLNKPPEELRRGIASLKKQIAQHQDKISSPEKHIPDWSSLDPRKREALLKQKWPEDIHRQTEQLEILEELLKKAERTQRP
jgi:hypothetical protein